MRELCKKCINLHGEKNCWQNGIGDDSAQYLMYNCNSCDSFEEEEE